MAAAPFVRLAQCIHLKLVGLVSYIHPICTCIHMTINKELALTRNNVMSLAITFCFNNAIPKKASLKSLCILSAYAHVHVFVLSQVIATNLRTK